MVKSKARKSTKTTEKGGIIQVFERLKLRKGFLEPFAYTFLSTVILWSLFFSSSFISDEPEIFAEKDIIIFIAIDLACVFALSFVFHIILILVKQSRPYYQSFKTFAYPDIIKNVWLLLGIITSLIAPPSFLGLLSAINLLLLPCFILIVFVLCLKYILELW